MGLAAWVGLWIVAVARGPLVPGDSTRSVEVGGTTRTYRLHVPPGFDPARPTPLVLALHPFATNAATMARISGFDPVADRAGFLVAYPNGTGRGPLLRWNVGIDPADKTDDVAFLTRVIEDVSGATTVDPRRVFAAGFSNGAMMSYRLASERSDRVAAVAAVAGTMTTDPIRATRPVPVLHVHGTDDRMVAYDGRLWRDPGGARLRGVEDTVRAWARFNGCATTPETATLPRAKEDRLEVETVRWGGGRDGSEVILYRVVGGGHTWPGSAGNAAMPGNAADLDAAALIWDFFAAHPRH